MYFLSISPYLHRMQYMIYYMMNTVTVISNYVL